MFTVTKAKFLGIVGERNGQKQDGTEWSVKQYLFETQESKEQYNKKIVLEAFNKEFPLNEGYTFNVAYEAESREWEGRWFTSLRFVGLCNDEGKLLPQAAQEPEPEAEAPSSELPF